MFHRNNIIKSKIIKCLIAVLLITIDFVGEHVVAQTDDTVVLSDYYTVNIKKCQLIDVDELIRNPDPFVDKFICGYGRMLPNNNSDSGYEFLITGLQIPFDNTNNTASLIYSGVDEDTDILFEKLSNYNKDVNVFIYGRIYVANSKSKTRNDYFPDRNGLMFLKYPKVIILESEE